VLDIEAYIEHRSGNERLYRIYQSFDYWARLNDSIRAADDWVRSVVSRLIQVVIPPFSRVPLKSVLFFSMSAVSSLRHPRL
jgi:uncharacterized protein (DUF2236 family)